MTLAAMRAASAERARGTAGARQPVGQVVSGELPGPAGPIPVRIYTPAVPEVDRPLPGLVYFHGGGWLRGSLQTHDVLCRALANGAGCAVVSVDYRMAPEHVFSAAIEDALAATRWVALVLRDARGPVLVHQLLTYPVTDFSFDTPAYFANADDPPALVITAEYDPLGDEGRAYAERLGAAGTPGVHRDYPGLVHGFVTAARVVEAGQQAVRDAAAELRSAFSIRPAGVRVGGLVGGDSHL